MILGGFPEQIWRSRPRRAAFLLLGLPRRSPPCAGAARRRRRRARRRRCCASRRSRSMPAIPAGGASARCLSRRLGAEQRQRPLRRHLRAPRRGRRGDRAERRRHAVPLRAAGRAGRGARPHRAAPARARPGDAQVEPRHRIDGDRRRPAVGRVRAAQYDLALPPRRPRAPTASARPEPMRRWRGNQRPGGDGRGSPTAASWSSAKAATTADATSDAVLFAGDPARAGHAAPPRSAIGGVPGYRVDRRRPAAGRAAAHPQPALRLARGLSAVVTIAETRGLRAGGDDRGPRDRGAAAPLSVDNMEALSVTARTAGRSSGSPRTTISSRCSGPCC